MKMKNNKVEAIHEEAINTRIALLMKKGMNSEDIAYKLDLHPADIRILWNGMIPIKSNKK